MNGDVDFKDVFGHLCHFVALKQQGKLSTAINSIILTNFAMRSAPMPLNLERIGAGIEEHFGIRLPALEIQAAIETLVNEGKVLSQDDTYAPSPHAQSEYRNRIANAKMLEEQVKDEWLNDISEHALAMNCASRDRLWACLTDYMASAFYQHGASTIQLLDPSVPTSTTDNNSLRAYATRARSRHCHDMPEDQVVAAIERFFTSQSTSKTQYIVQLLDGTFTYFALVSDDVVAKYLSDPLPPAKLFIDTNIIFGILRLANHRQNIISTELIECINRHRFPFKLYYTTDTIEEFQRVLHYSATQLQRREWSSSVSALALKSAHISGIERRFHELNAARPISASHFLAPFRQVTTLLTDMGLLCFDHSQLIDDLEVIENSKLYCDYLVQHRGEGKRNEVIQHDVLLMHIVKSERKAGANGLGVGAFLLTLDYQLSSFERFTRGQNDQVPITVFPNQLLQLLRPFMTTTEEVNKRFVEAFALPELRVANEGYAETTSKVLRLMNSYTELRDEIAIRILTDEMTLRQFVHLDEDSEEIRQTLDEEIAKDNVSLAERNAELADKATLQERELNALRGELAEKERISNEVQIEKRELENQVAADAEQRAKRELAARNSQRALVIAIVFAVAILSILAFFAATVLSSWLETHPNRNALYIVSLFEVLLVAFRIGLWHRWRWLKCHQQRTSLQLSAIVVMLGLLIGLADPSSISITIVGGVISVGILTMLNKIDESA